MGAVHFLPVEFSVPLHGAQASSANLQVFTHGGGRWLRIETDSGNITMALTKQQAEALSDAFLDLARRISS